MKEITRIHIAKTAYDIELAAKKAIEKYIAALERYADDPELLSDIEIRITELLMERGVKPGDVITVEDVVAVRAQLGEPSEFLPEGAGDIAVGSETNDEPRRRVYRDTDSAVLGGVMAGFGRFFGIDPLWVRLIFIVLLFASFGAAIIAYLILWLIIPPARTAADKLRMNGEPVTLESIKRLSAESESSQYKKVRYMQEILIYGAGVLLVLLALGSLIAVIAAITSFGFGTQYSSITNRSMVESPWFIIMMILLSVSGILLAALCSMLANATFRRQWTKRTTIATISIVAAGLVTFVGGIGAAMYGSLDDQARISQARKTTQANLPAAFSGVSSLRIVSDGALDTMSRIEYRVSDTPHYELESLPGVKPEIDVSADGLSATVRLAKNTINTKSVWGGTIPTLLVIYGPALDTITLEDSTSLEYSNNSSQEALAVVLQKHTRFNLEGVYTNVNITSQPDGSATLDRTTITNLSTSGGTVQAGVVNTLTVHQPEACAAFEPGSNVHRVHVQAVSSGVITYNGAERPAKTVDNSCGKVVVGPEVNDRERGDAE